MKQEKCVFCEIASIHSIAVVKFKPLNPVTSGHMLFIPRKHYKDAAVDDWVTGLVFSEAARYGRRQGEDFNLITSIGKEATQTIMHFHVHYVPRRENDKLKLPWTGQLK